MSATSTRRVGLLEACDDRRLFAVALWPRQRDLVAELDTAAGAVWALGRRSGKTTLASVACLHNCLFRPDLDGMVRPGETRYALAVATNLEQAQQLVASARLIVEGSPILAGLLERQTTDGLWFKLPGGARTAIRAFPCSSRAVRGYAASMLVLDEAAHFVSTEDGNATARRVYDALRPTTLQFGDRSQVLVISSPLGTSGFFAEQFTKADAGELPGWHARQLASAAVNPTLDEAFLELVRAEQPETFESEYLALFEAGGDAFFDRSRFEPDAALEPATVDQGVGWVAGLDPAFTSDAFGLALVGHADGRLVLGPVEAIQPERRRGLSFAARREVEDRTLAAVAERCKSYRASVYTDQHQSQAIVGRFREQGLAATVVSMTRETKYAAFRELRDRLYDGTLPVPAHGELLTELSMVRFKLGGGGVQIILPRSARGHCDQAQALALAVYQARHGRGSTGRSQATSRRHRPLTAGVLRMRW